MASTDAQHRASLARIHALHRQYFGEPTSMDREVASRPQTAHAPIIPPIDDDEIVFTNPFTIQQAVSPFPAPQRGPVLRHLESASTPMPYVESAPFSQQLDPLPAPRRMPAPGLFRQIDWKNDRSDLDMMREQHASTLKRAPSASSSASGSSKVKAQKENGIFRKTSQKYSKFSRAMKDGLATRSRRPSGSEMMEGVELSAPTPESPLSSSTLPGPHNKALGRLTRMTKNPRHDTPQPLNVEGAPRNTSALPSSSALHVPYSHHRYSPVSHFAHNTMGGEAARRAAAESNGFRYHRPQPPPTSQPSYQMRRDSYRGSIGSMPTASDSGADLVSMLDIEMVDAEKPVVIRVDPVAVLPTEIVTLIFSNLDAPTLKSCRKVNRSWATIAVDPIIWRGQYLHAFEKEVYVEPAPIQIGGVGTGRPNLPIQQWELMYDARKQLNQNWARGEEGGKAVYLSGHTDSVYCVQFDEDKIITGSRDRTIRVWDMHTFECLKVIGGPTVKPTPGPKRLRTVDAQKLLGTVESVNGTIQGDRIYHVPSDFHSASILCLQYDDEILVTGSSDNDLLVWDIKTFEPLQRLRHHGGGVLDVAFDSKHIVSCSKDCTIVVWDRKTLQPIRSLTGHRGPVNAVQLRGNLLVSASGDGVARLWDLNKMECVREFPPKERGLAAVEFSDDAKYVLAGGNDHTTYKFDVATGAEVKTFTGHTQLVRSLFLDTQNRRVVSGSYDLDLRVYDYDSGELLGRFGEWTTSWMLAAKSDYRRIVSTSQDGRILVIDFGQDMKRGGEIPGVNLLEARAHMGRPNFS